MTIVTSYARFVGLTFAAASLAVVATSALVAVSLDGSAQAATTGIDLGTAGQFVVLAGVPGATNTGSTTIQVPAGVRGDLGTGSGVAISGSASISWLNPPPGSIHLGDAVAAAAQADNLTAYAVAKGAPSSPSFGGQLDQLTFLPGVHTASSALNLAVNGTVRLDAQGDPDADFIIQVGSSLTMESGSTVELVGGAQSCHVFWQVSQDATIKSGATFAGNLLAQNAIVAGTNATIQGRLLAQNASVTLDDNTFVLPACSAPVGLPGGGGSTTPPTTSAPTSAPPTPTRPAPTNRPTHGVGAGSGGGGSSSDDGIGVTTGGGGDTGTSSSGTTSLPHTGGPPKMLLPIGMAAMLVGTGMVLAVRQRRGDHRA